MKQTKSILLIAVTLVVISCSNNKQTQQLIEDSASAVEAAPANNILPVIEDTELFDGPNSTTKLVNHKATEMIGETQFLSIDESCTVRILDEKDGWYKIQVVTPDWLSQSHIGWVKKDVIGSPEDDTKEEELSLKEGSDYIILADENIGAQNLYCYVNGNNLKKEELKKIALYIKDKHGSASKVNVHLYDSKKLGDLISKIHLNDNEYLKVADHYLYFLDFDNLGSFYPYQDIKYKELGGKNWKKEPIK